MLMRQRVTISDLFVSGRAIIGAEIFEDRVREPRSGHGRRVNAKKVKAMSIGDPLSVFCQLSQ
jgi:hypothetical protein